MIHAAIDLLMVGFDVAGVWLKHDLGPIDYRTVRVVFFSTFAALTALELVRAVVSVAYVVRQLLIFYVPVLPEIQLLLGWITRDQYERQSYRLFRCAARLFVAACLRAEQDCQAWFAPGKS